MRLGLGARLGSYQIVAPLGAGGMGEVYRGTDTRLKREVAIRSCLRRSPRTTSVSRASATEVDRELVGWLRKAYEKA